MTAVNFELVQALETHCTLIYSTRFDHELNKAHLRIYSSQFGSIRVHLNELGDIVTIHIEIDAKNEQERLEKLVGYLLRGVKNG